jgi:hypothetical protein
MSEIIIPQILDALKAVSHSNADNLHIFYDRGDDAMYVTFGQPVPPDHNTLGDDGIIYKYRDGKVIGLTVDHFSSR